MPTFDSHPNFAVSTIAVVPSAGTTASAQVASGTGSRFASGPFDAVICPANTIPTPANAEVVRILAQAGDIISIQRAQESSSQRTVQVGDSIFAAPTGKVFTDIEAAINALPARGPATWYTSETGTPSPLNSASPLYGDPIMVGDWIIREGDGEVFEWSINPGNGSHYASDLGFGTQGGNPVASTVARAFLGTTSAQQTAGSTFVVPFDSNSYDPGGQLSTAAKGYRCPVAGYYRVKASIDIQVAAGSYQISTYLNKNGTIVSVGVGPIITESAAASQVTQISDTILCAAGDIITLSTTTGVAFTVFASSSATFMDVSLVAPLTNAPVAPNTAARAYRATAMATPNAGTAWVKLPIDTVATGNDPGGHMDVITNHRYNVSSAGWYQVSGQLDVASTASGQYMFATIYKNGVEASRGSATYAAGAAEGINANVSDLIYCAAGDYLELWYLCSTAGLSFSVGSTANYLSVVKVDQPVPNGGSNTGWFTPTVASPWTAGVSGAPQYMKDANGFVHLRGSVGSTAVENQVVAFTLPAGFRPGISDYYPALQNTGAAGAVIHIDTSGNVIGTIAAANYSLFLAGVSFLAEN